jgi:hypothetical protein
MLGIDEDLVVSFELNEKLEDSSKFPLALNVGDVVTIRWAGSHPESMPTQFDASK